MYFSKELVKKAREKYWLNWGLDLYVNETLTNEPIAFNDETLPLKEKEKHKK